MSLSIQSFFSNQMNNLSYLLVDQISHDCIIVDPTFNISEILATIASSKLNLVGIWLTHAHYDHVFGLEDIYTSYKDCPLFVSTLSCHKFSQYQNVHALDKGDAVWCGEHKFTIIVTPGHSPDGLCFYSKPHLISGDTLFIDRCGRADFSDSKVEDLYKSLQQLKSLPSDTIIYPGHDYGKTQTDTMGNQLIQNPYLAVSSEQEFIRLRMGR